jgi:hypothetical protein
VRAPGRLGEGPGALGCRSGRSSPNPRWDGQRYSKCSLLTVMLRLQVQNCLLARLWLILTDPMALAIQQSLGSNVERVKHQSARNGTPLAATGTVSPPVPVGCLE